MFFDEFYILAAQKKHSTEFISLIFYKDMENVKLGHALSFYTHRNIFSQLFKNNYWVQVKRQGFLSPPYLVVMDSFSILSKS